MAKPHIGIDGNEANVVNRVGSNQFAFEILKSLHAIGQEAQFTVYLKDLPVNDMPLENKHWRYRVITPAKLWTQWRLPLELYTRARNLDVFYSPGHYAPRKAPMPTVVTILDLSFLKFPNLFLKLERGVAQLTQWTEYSAKQAAHIITISQNTRQDIIEHYHLDSSMISIAYPGIDHNFFKPASKSSVAKVRQKYNLPPHFILYLGTLQPRKNLLRLLNAFEKLPPKFRDFHLVIAGQRGWLYEEFLQAVQNSPKKDKVLFTDFVDRQDLPALYTAAATLALVGLYEGFGIPPAESLACGTIPVVSNTSSLPEVVGEAGITVDPYSVTGIRHGIMAAITLPETKRQKRLALASDHLKQFNWQKSAAIIYKALYDIALQR
jgi:glycosyltransferase involved in cell wall biosynthesis